MVSSEGKKSQNKKERRRDFLEAKNRLEKMQETIAPFVKRRRFGPFSTKGQWCDASSGCSASGDSESEAN